MEYSFCLDGNLEMKFLKCNKIFDLILLPINCMTLHLEVSSKKRIKLQYHQEIALVILYGLTVLVLEKDKAII